MRLVKTAELDPEHNYVLGFHPHGIISFSAFVTFATEALDISEEYPGGPFGCNEASGMCMSMSHCLCM